MKIKLFLSLIGLALVVVVFFSQCGKKVRQPEQIQDTTLQKISDYLDWEGENGFSGVILVKIPGQQAFIRSYGYANEEQRLSNTDETVFDIGSVTKQFTAAAILKLQMQGRLSVNDSIGKFLPQLSGALSVITIHQLLTHTSGLPFQIGTQPDIISREELISRITETQLSAQAGNAFYFSHAGYNLLGLIIEEVSGMSYEEYLDLNLFKPAGMKHTGYRIPDWSSLVIAHGYRDCKDWGKPMDSGWSEDGPSWNQRASGGMLSTINDLFLWHEALLGNDILDKPSKEAYYKPYVTDGRDSNRSSAYGWLVIKSSRNTNAIAHFGFNGRFYSDFLRYLEEDVTIILLSNKLRFGDRSVTYEIAKCIFWNQYRPQLRGQQTLCYDSLPDNRPGRLAGRFINLLDTGTVDDWKKFIEEEFASHFIKKYSIEHLLNTVLDIQKKSGKVVIRQISLTDNRLMELALVKPPDSKEVFLRMVFDENEDYKIRGISFDSPENPGQGRMPR